MSPPISLRTSAGGPMSQCLTTSTPVSVQSGQSLVLACARARTTAGDSRNIAHIERWRTRAGGCGNGVSGRSACVPGYFEIGAVGRPQRGMMESGRQQRRAAVDRLRAHRRDACGLGSDAYLPVPGAAVAAGRLPDVSDQHNERPDGQRGLTHPGLGGNLRPADAAAAPTYQQRSPAVSQRSQSSWRG